MTIKNMKDLKKVKNLKDLNLHSTFRAHIIYEQIMGESFNANAGLNGVIVLFFSYIMGCNKDANLDYEEWFDWLDANPDILGEFTDWLISVNAAKSKLEGEPAGEEAPKEKDGGKKNE